MSASPQRFTFVPQTTTPEALFPPATPTRESEVSAQREGAVHANQTRLYTTFAIVLTLAGGILAGYFLYLLWEQVALHDSQIARQQVALDRLTANGAAVSNQVGRLKAIDRDVDSIKDLLQLQSKKVAELERGQNPRSDGGHERALATSAPGPRQGEGGYTHRSFFSRVRSACTGCQRGSAAGCHAAAPSRSPATASGEAQ
jgi:hypothetical protein